MELIIQYVRFYVKVTKLGHFQHKNIFLVIAEKRPFCFFCCLFAVVCLYLYSCKFRFVMVVRASLPGPLCCIATGPNKIYDASNYSSIKAELSMYLFKHNLQGALKQSKWHLYDGLKKTKTISVGCRRSSMMAVFTTAERLFWGFYLPVKF